MTFDQEMERLRRARLDDIKAEIDRLGEIKDETQRLEYIKSHYLVEGS